jgi:uncharacterized protein (TIGR03435 family)
MSDLAAALSRFSDRPVVDKTGLIGLYNIQTAGWVPLRPRPARTTDPTPSQAAEDAAFADPSRPTAFDVFEKLGLKLESQKGSVETLTLVHAESPSEN